MKNIFYLLTVLFFPLITFADGDTSNIPISRQSFHDKIIAEQQRADKADGKLDNLLKLSNTEDVNLQVTDAIYRQVNVLRNEVESNATIATNNDKIRYLRYIENRLREEFDFFATPIRLKEKHKVRKKKN